MTSHSSGPFGGGIRLVGLLVLVLAGLLLVSSYFLKAEQPQIPSASDVNWLECNGLLSKPGGYYVAFALRK